MKAKNLDINRNAGSLDITYTWRSPVAFFLIFFCLVWDLAVFGFLFAGAGIFAGIHLLVGVALSYYTICLLFNRTTIRVSSAILAVHHGPVPSFRKNHDVPSRRVSQLYVRKDGTYKQGSKVTQLYRLSAEIEGGQEIHLLRSLRDEELAHSVERDIESYLNIIDEPRPEPTLELPDLEQIKEHLPGFMRRSIERMEEAGLADESVEQAAAVLSRRGKASQEAEPAKADVHEAHPSYDFALCHAPAGTEFNFMAEPATLLTARQLEWRESETTSARELVIRTAREGQKYVYATPVLGRWQYFEERPLDAEECAALGFDGALAPHSLRNGDDRYYADTPLNGQRVVQGVGEPVEQRIYHSSRASSLFRAIKGHSGRWEVYVQESIDGSHFSGRD